MYQSFGTYDKLDSDNTANCNKIQQNNWVVTSNNKLLLGNCTEITNNLVRW